MMYWQRLAVPNPLLVIAIVMLLAIGVACGGTATPEETAGAADAAADTAPTPTIDRLAGAEEPTPTAPLDATPTPVPVPTAMAVDQRPDWWIEGEDKRYRGDFPLVAQYNPGFWDVHYGGSMNTVLIPSGPRFNQLFTSSTAIGCGA